MESLKKRVKKINNTEIMADSIGDNFGPKLKVMHAILNIICVVAFMVSLVRLILYYCSEPRATRQSVDYYQSLRLPDVAICAPYQLNITKLLADGYTWNQIYQFYWHFTQEDYNELSVPPLDPQILKSSQNLIVSRNTSTNVTGYGAFLDYYAADCDKLFRTCHIEHGYEFDCCQSSVQVTHEKYGRCFVFRHFEQKYEGAHYGLIFVLNTKVENLNWSRDVSSLLPTSAGLAVEIAQHYQPPRTFTVRGQTLVSPHKLTYLGLSSIQYQRYQSRLNPCRKSQSAEQYSFTGCSKRQWNLIVQMLCNCTLLGFEVETDIKDATICSPYMVRYCYHNVFVDHIPNMYNMWVQQNCTRPCNEQQYTAQISTTDLIKERISAALNDSIEYENEHQYYKLHVFYSKMQVARLVEIGVLNFDSALTGLGGLLGLYLGTSILGVIRACLQMYRLVGTCINEKCCSPINVNRKKSEINNNAKPVPQDYIQKVQTSLKHMTFNQHQNVASDPHIHINLANVSTGLQTL